jgi:hypothetical protein
MRNGLFENLLAGCNLSHLTFFIISRFFHLSTINQVQSNGCYVPKAPIAGADINGCYLKAAIRI